MYILLPCFLNNENISKSSRASGGSSVDGWRGTQEAGGETRPAADTKRHRELLQERSGALNSGWLLAGG